MEVSASLHIHMSCQKHLTSFILRREGWRDRGVEGGREKRQQSIKWNGPVKNYHQSWHNWIKMTDHETLCFTLYQMSCQSQLSAELPATMIISPATVKIFEKSANISVSNPSEPLNGWKWRDKVGRKKEIDSNRRGKLVITSTRRTIQDFDYCMEQGTMPATKWAFVCQRFDSKGNG